VTLLFAESAVLLLTFGTLMISISLVKICSVISSSTVSRGAGYESFDLLKSFLSPFIVNFLGFRDPFFTKVIDGTQLRTVLVEFQRVTFATGVRTLDDFVSSC